MENKISIKEFCEGYKKIVLDKDQERYIKKNLKVKPYIPFIMKEVIANNLAEISMFEYEVFVDENGQEKKRKTGNVKISSSMYYLFFCRAVIESYTNLTIESEGFYDEYDMLNELGLMDEITKSIPEKELKELKMICDMKKNDVIFNNATPEAYVSQQVERFASISSVILKPILERIETEINDMDESKMDKVLNKIDGFVKLVK